MGDKRFLLRLEEIPDPGSRGFSLGRGEAALEGFLIRREGGLHAYRNRCPHIGAPMDWMPHQFLDREGRYIQCAMHGALFEPDTGLCVSGPCVDRRLEPLPLVVEDGKVYLLAGISAI